MSWRWGDLAFDRDPPADFTFQSTPREGGVQENIISAATNIIFFIRPSPENQSVVSLNQINLDRLASGTRTMNRSIIAATLAVTLMASAPALAEYDGEPFTSIELGALLSPDPEVQSLATGALLGAVSMWADICAPVLLEPEIAGGIFQGVMEEALGILDQTERYSKTLHLELWFFARHVIENRGFKKMNCTGKIGE